MTGGTGAPAGWETTTEYGISWDTAPDGVPAQGVIPFADRATAVKAAGIYAESLGWSGIRVVARTVAKSPWGPPPGRTSTDAADCKCVENCDEDPATACDLSGIPHVHPDTTGTGAFGPCPVHPDAPGDH